jgi:hypothetical protein
LPADRTVIDSTDQSAVSWDVARCRSGVVWADPSKHVIVVGKVAPDQMRQNAADQD